MAQNVFEALFDGFRRRRRRHRVERVETIPNRRTRAFETLSEKSYGLKCVYGLNWLFQKLSLAPPRRARRDDRDTPDESF